MDKRNPEYVEIPISQLGAGGAMMAENQIKKMAQRIAELEEFINEIAAGPYPDSDPASLLETLQRRAMRLSAQQQNAAELLPPICPWCMTAHKPKENPKCLK